jgi:hypothetical protein
LNASVGERCSGEKGRRAGEIDPKDARGHRLGHNAEVCVLEEEVILIDLVAIYPSEEVSPKLAAQGDVGAPTDLDPKRF